MTVREVRAAVARVERLKSDNEAAHLEEDALYREVLASIANRRGDEPALLATEALRASKVRYHRWYA